MALPIAELVTGSVTGIGVLGLIIDRLAEKKKIRRMNGEDPPYIASIKASLSAQGKVLVSQNEVLVELKDRAAENHEGIEVIKANIGSIKETCNFHRDSQDKINDEFKDHLVCLDKKVYDLATKP